MVAYSRPKLTKVLSKPVLYVDKIPENESVEIQVDRARFFPKGNTGSLKKSNNSSFAEEKVTETNAG